MKINFASDFQGLFEPHTPEESAQLEENMLADISQIPPCVLWANGPKPNTMIEGHERYRIAQKHGLKIGFRKLKFDDREQALDYARKAQLARRNISNSQRAMVVAELTKRRKHEGKPDSNSTNLSSLQGMAQQAGTSRGTMAAATKVSERGAEPVKRGVRAGKFAAYDAATIADKPKAEQAKIAAKAEREGTTLKKAAIDFNPPPIEEREWGDGDALEDVRADLNELHRRCGELNGFVRLVLRCEKNEITRPFCNCYSLLTISQPILHIARSVKNDMPVGGTAKKPILFHEQKAQEAAK